MLSPTTRPIFFLLLRPPPRSTLFPYTTLFRSLVLLLHARMYCAQAFIWLRIGASEVLQFGAVSTVPSFSMSWPWWRPKLTQSPPSEASPWWHFQKFSRSSALISVAGELTRL